MSQAAPSRLPKPINFLFENSIFLIAGTLAALLWANTNTESYESLVHYTIVGGDGHHDIEETHLQEATDHDEHALETAPENQSETRGFLADLYHRVVERPDENGQNHGINLHFLINDILMALFFATAAGEVWEALLPGGSLSNPKQAVPNLLPKPSCQD